MNKKEQTLVVIKPDGVQRSLIGDVVSRFERMGLKMVAAKMTIPSEELVERHYLANPNWKVDVGEKSIDAYKKQGLNPPSEDPVEIGNAVLRQLKEYLTSGPVLAMVFSPTSTFQLGFAK